MTGDIPHLLKLAPWHLKDLLKSIVAPDRKIVSVDIRPTGEYYVTEDVIRKQSLHSYKLLKSQEGEITGFRLDTNDKDTDIIWVWTEPKE